MQLAILIFFCGGFGALLRHLISVAIALYRSEVEKVLCVRSLKVLQEFGLEERSICDFRNLKFPWATLGANALAAFILGSLVAFSINNSAVVAWFDRIETIFRLQKNVISQAMMVGFCGSLSTFSTFTRDTLVLVENGNYTAAIFNVFANMVFSALLFLGGMKLATNLL